MADVNQREATSVTLYGLIFMITPEILRKLVEGLR